MKKVIRRLIWEHFKMSPIKSIKFRLYLRRVRRERINQNHPEHYCGKGYPKGNCGNPNCQSPK